MVRNENRFSRMLPRLIRLRDAPFYLGMDRNRFNADVRPYLTQIPIGDQGIAFDRLEIDAWLEEYIQRNGRRPTASQMEDDVCQNAINSQGSASKAVSGKLRKDVNTPKEAGSGKAREQLAEWKQKKS